MANCKPVDVSRFVWAHNVAMALLSLWMRIATVKAVRLSSFGRGVPEQMNPMELPFALLSTLQGQQTDQVVSQEDLESML